MRWRVIFPILALALLCSEGRAQVFDNFTYIEESGEITITQFPQNWFGAVLVPSTIDGKPVTSIAQNAFYRCKTVSSISLPDSIRSIGHGAFYDCEGLSSFTISRNVTTIGVQVFSECSGLESISVAAQNLHFSSEGGILYNAPKTQLIKIPEDTDGDITIPSSVHTLRDRAITGCRQIRTVSVPASVTNMGLAMFAGCDRLTAIVVDPANPNFSSADGLLFDKEATTLLRCPGGKPGTVEVASGTEIASGAFAGASSIEGIVLPAGTASIVANMFYDCASLRTFTIPESVTSIGRSAFARCFALEEIEIPDTVDSIGDNAFYVCSSLSRVRLPSHLTAIGSGWFHGCDALGDIIIPDGVVSIGDDAFSNSLGLSQIILPESLQVLGVRAFFNTGLRTVRVPAAVESIGTIALSLCPDLVEIEVASDNQFYRSIDGILYSKDLTQLIQCPAAKSGRVTVPASVTEIPMNAFSHCNQITVVRFMGNAPSWGLSAETYFEVLYFQGRTGFDGDTWMGYPAINDGQPTPLGSWLVSHDQPYDIDLSATSAEESGVDLLLAYALDLDPGMNPAGALPRLVINGDSMSLTFFAGRFDIVYTPERSTDLGIWDTEGLTLSNRDQNGYRTASCLLTGETKFIRLRVSPR
jgi:hypothetical protein